MTQAPSPLGTRAAYPESDRSPRIGAHLFLELRGVADLLATGAPTDAAAALLRFNRLVADTAARYAGADLRAEGDDAYVTFSNIADAIASALTIAGSAEV